MKGQSLVEVILALAIFALIAAGLASMAVGGFRGLEQGGEQTQAWALAQEGIEAVRAVHDRAWNEIKYNQSGVTINNGQWQLVGEGTTDTIGQYTRTISFTDICRDGSGDVTAGCPGTYTDVHSQRVTSKIDWTIRPGVTNNVQQIAYLTNWGSRDWLEDLTADFNDGTFNGTEVSATLGDGDGAITLQGMGGPATASQMIALWDGATIPTGWTCVSCNSGDAFYQKFIKGAATYGGSGGTDTTTHTVSWVSSTGPSATYIGPSGSDGQFASGSHTHNSLTSGSTGAVSTLPAYRSLKVIRFNTVGEPDTLPAGLIGIFDANVPAGWTRYSDQDGRFIRGDTTAGLTGGSDTHTHTVSMTTGGPSATVGSNSEGAPDAASTTHTHSGSGTNVAVDNKPPYIEIVLGKLNTDAPPPNGLIIMWDNTPPSSWNGLSATGQAFSGQYQRGAAAYNGTSQGAATHNHSNLILTTGGPSASSRSGSGTGVTLPTASHTHNLTVSFSSNNHEPPYIEAIFAKRNAPIVLKLTQSAYRWFANDNATTVSTALASQDTAATLPAQGQAFRLRLSVHIAEVDLGISGQNFKLQFAVRSGVCDAAFVGETYTDVTAATEIAYNNNSIPGDGANLTTNATLDPIHNGHTTVSQTYEELNNLTNSVAAIPVGQDGQWDFALINNNAPGGTSYCFRVVKSDGTLLDVYNIIPELRSNVGTATGTYISSSFNTQAVNVFNVIAWTWSKSNPSCAVCSVRLQIQTAPDSSGSPGTWSATWSGPEGEDGDETDYFTVSTGELIHTDHNGDQWVRYKATLEGDSQGTPILEQVKINYQR